jgi:hypothetical protein
MEQEALYQLLLNYGGMGLLAAVMVFFHLKATKEFREEREADRTSRHAANESANTLILKIHTDNEIAREKDRMLVREVSNGKHMQIMEKLTALENGAGCESTQRRR